MARIKNEIRDAVLAKLDITEKPKKAKKTPEVEEVITNKKGKK